MLACPNEHKLIQKTVHEKANPKIKLPQNPTTNKNTVQSCEIEEMWLTIQEN